MGVLLSTVTTAPPSFLPRRSMGYYDLVWPKPIAKSPSFCLLTLKTESMPPFPPGLIGWLPPGLVVAMFGWILREVKAGEARQEKRMDQMEARWEKRMDQSETRVREEIRELRGLLIKALTRDPVTTE